MGMGRLSAPSTRTWIIIGISVAGTLILAEASRRQRSRRRRSDRVQVPSDFGAFVERFELSPSPQPPPPAAKLPLAGLTFAIADNFDVEGFVSGYGNPDWRRTHGAASRTAAVVSLLLRNGAACVGRTVMDEFAFGMTGDNMHYGAPINPESPINLPGGSLSGSAVAVAAKLVDFSLGTDTTGCLRIPASFCGVLGFRPSHGTVSCNGVVANSQSLDAVGWFARDSSILHRVANVLLQPSSSSPRRERRFIVADDCFQLSKVPKQKTVHVLHKTIEKLSGYQPPKHMNIGSYIASNVPSLKGFQDTSAKIQHGLSSLKALSSVMTLLRSFEFKTNHEEWINTLKPKMGHDISKRVREAISSTYEDIKLLYNVRAELRSALNNLVKDDGILVLPSTSDFSSKRESKVVDLDVEDRMSMLLSIAGFSGCCQVTVPFGKHDSYPVSVSFIAAHGADKFLLGTLVDIFPSLQQEISIASNLSSVPDSNGSMDASELLKEKGNAAYKGRQWNKAINFYSEAIKLNDTNSTYYSNRAAAYLALGCFQQAEADCNQAIMLDKKNVKAYYRRGTAREMLLFFKDAARDYNHALVLEPQNKAALEADKRLRKRMS